MPSYRNTTAGVDPARHLRHALAALREAAECIEEATPAGEPPEASVADAASHVAAARAAIRARDLWGGSAEPERDAA